MSIISFSFLVFLCFGVAVYYILPKKLQWVELLILSIIFYINAAEGYTILYVIASTAIAYICTLCIDCMRKHGRPLKTPFLITIVALILNIAIWLIVKGRYLWSQPLSMATKYIKISGLQSISELQLIAALGMGYYTLQIMGYIIDCYWENEIPQKNPLKLLLFTAFFPQMITGPISRYDELKSMYEGRKFNYQNLAFGAQRILWGFVKKIVLAERVGIIVSAITSNSDTYAGFYTLIAILLYPVQMYADFSGCMDIVLGASEMFGIKLAENFNNPFFSRTSKEFWQRWHITLGTWAKDYVLFPLLKTNTMVKMGKLFKKKKLGKFLTNAVGMFILWMVMGIWHGGYRYIVGVSLWYWIVLMLGNLLEPLSLKILKMLNVKTKSFGWHLFQSVRTYCIYAIGATFFNVGIAKAISLFKDLYKTLFVEDYANPWIFFDGSILKLGVTYVDLNIIILSVAIMIIVAVLREKYSYARYWVAEQSFLFRWMIWIGLFVFVLIWGMYGPGYNAAEFIYEGF